MKYAILLLPHANSRYVASQKQLSIAELTIMFARSDIKAEIYYRDYAGVEWLCFDSDTLSEDQIAIIKHHSSLYILAQLHENGAFMPIATRVAPVFGSDMAGILKYKGKTNEQFTELLINCALFSSGYASHVNTRLEVLDPMCGKGTTLFAALNRGYNASGIEMDKADTKELSDFFTRYIQYHKLKLQVNESSATVKNTKRSVRKVEYQVAKDSLAFKSGDRSILTVATGDAMDGDSIYKKSSFHAIAVDLPYGVQHLAGTHEKHINLEDLLKIVLPVWRGLLKPNGAIALSFNNFTLKTESLRNILRSTGFEVLVGGAYDGFEHWVEQAVNRDIVIGIKK